jgi:hypothetical protein
VTELALLVALVAITAAIAALAARHFRPEIPLGWPMGATSREEFWRRSMPWPHGVQEDSDIAWHAPRRESTRTPSIPPDRPIPPTRPQGRLVSR